MLFFADDHTRLFHFFLVLHLRLVRTHSFIDCAFGLFIFIGNSGVLHQLAEMGGALILFNIDVLGDVLFPPLALDGGENALAFGKWT